jgi:hypothetical protein
MPHVSKRRLLRLFLALRRDRMVDDRRHALEETAHFAGAFSILNFGDGAIENFANSFRATSSYRPTVNRTRAGLALLSLKDAQIFFGQRLSGANGSDARSEMAQLQTRAK